MRIQLQLPSFEVRLPENLIGEIVHRFSLPCVSILLNRRYFTMENVTKQEREKSCNNLLFGFNRPITGISFFTCYHEIDRVVGNMEDTSRKEETVAKSIAIILVVITIVWITTEIAIRKQKDPEE